MEKFFLSVLNMSLTASFVIAAIILVRLPLKKAPKTISYALWAVAGFRLVFPITMESVFSLLPIKSAPIPQDIAMQAVPRIDSGITAIDNAVSAVLPAAAAAASVNPLQIWLFIGSCVWIVGIAVMLIYSFVSIIMLKRGLRGAALIEGSLYAVDNLKTPFVIGLFRARIYIPAGLNDEERRYIVLHEQTHIERHDHLVKMFAYLVLCLHWFNPLAWAAFILMGADMEMSCDERVMRKLGGGIKNAYSLSLVRVAAGRKILNGSPLAFGEGGMKERIKNVLNFKKPSRVIIVAAVTLAAVLSVGFAVNRASESLPWTDVPQKADWPVRDMSFDRVTFGSDRDLIVYRRGREPDSEDVLADETILYYHDPGAIYTPEGGQPSIVPGSAFDVTYYLGKNDCMYKKNLHGLYRMDIEGGNPGAFEMTGREMNTEGIAGTLEGVLDEYGGPNEVTHNGDIYTLWYYRPDDTDKRLWFDVKDGELTGRMGIVCLCEGEGIGAEDAARQLADSVTNADGQILFQIPPRYYNPFDWNIHIAGRAESEDGFGMSIHEYEDVNENHTWEAGRWYTIPIEGRHLTELTMDIHLPDEHGNAISQSVDLLAAAGVNGADAYKPTESNINALPSDTSSDDALAATRTETVTLEGLSEEIQTRLFVSTDGYIFYYDFESYGVAVDGNKTIIYPENDHDMRYAYAAIEYIANVSIEDELRRRMDEAAKTYTEVTRYDETDGYYAVHEDGSGGLWSIDDYCLDVKLISDNAEGCYVVSLWHIMEAAEGHRVRLRYMLDSFTLTTRGSSAVPSADDAEAELVKYNYEPQALFVRDFITAVETKNESVIEEYFTPPFELISKDDYMWIDCVYPDIGEPVSYTLFAYDSEYTVRLSNYSIESKSDVLLHFEGTRTRPDGSGGIVFYNVRVTHNGKSCVVSSYETDI